jgi:hypothetical protein
LVKGLKMASEFVAKLWLTWKSQIHLLGLWLGKNVSLMVLYMIGLLESGLWTVDVVGN